MRVAFISHMFPNSMNPHTTPFMVGRAAALTRLVDTKIIAPVSYIPVLHKKLPKINEEIFGLQVFHPRYLTLPYYLYKYRWIPYFYMLNKSTYKALEGCDILHVEWIYPDAYAVAKYAKLNGLKTVGVVHGNEAIEYFGPRRFKPLIKKTICALDRLIVVSNDLKEKLVCEYDVSADKITVILNGVDLHDFPIIDQGNARSLLNLTSHEYFGVVVARLSPEKNLDVLINAIAGLGHKAPVIKIIGGGPERVNLESLISKLNVASKIQLIGEVPHKDISNWLNAADFFCLPSQREGCPVVIHEALACGIPVVSTTVGAIPDLINSKEYGLLCPPSDVTALAELLVKVCTIKWNREKISSYGRSFTWDKVAAQTATVLQETLSC
jgi:teichuronic acid biosynthesis glycosyltransferase TuaC